jgi:hypothetical protein
MQVMWIWSDSGSADPDSKKFPVVPFGTVSLPCFRLLLEHAILSGGSPRLIVSNRELHRVRTIGIFFSLYKKHVLLSRMTISSPSSEKSPPRRPSRAK